MSFISVPSQAIACDLPAATPLVFIVDDDFNLRTAISRWLLAAGLAVEAYASSGEFLRRAPALTPSCLLVDVRHACSDGLALPSKLRSRNNGVPVIMMSGNGDVPMTVRAMKAGAIDFLGKPLHQGALLSAISGAIDTDRLRLHAEHTSAALEQRYRTLTPREREIMALVARGLMNKQIAGHVGTSEITVKIQRGRAMTKMQARTVADLVRMAGALGLELGLDAAAAPAARSAPVWPHNLERRA